MEKSIQRNRQGKYSYALPIMQTRPIEHELKIVQDIAIQVEKEFSLRMDLCSRLEAELNERLRQLEYLDVQTLDYSNELARFETILDSSQERLSKVSADYFALNEYYNSLNSKYQVYLQMVASVIAAFDDIENDFNTCKSFLEHFHMELEDAFGRIAILSDYYHQIVKRSELIQLELLEKQNYDLCINSTRMKMKCEIDTNNDTAMNLLATVEAETLEYEYALLYIEDLRSSYLSIMCKIPVFERSLQDYCSTMKESTGLIKQRIWEKSIFSSNCDILLQNMEEKVRDLNQNKENIFHRIDYQQNRKNDVEASILLFKNQYSDVISDLDRITISISSLEESIAESNVAISVLKFKYKSECQECQLFACSERNLSRSLENEENSTILLYETIEMEMMNQEEILIKSNSALEKNNALIHFLETNIDLSLTQLAEEYMGIELLQEDLYCLQIECAWSRSALEECCLLFEDMNVHLDIDHFIELVIFITWSYVPTFVTELWFSQNHTLSMVCEDNFSLEYQLQHIVEENESTLFSIADLESMSDLIGQEIFQLNHHTLDASFLDNAVKEEWIRIRNALELDHEKELSSLRVNIDAIRDKNLEVERNWKERLIALDAKKQIRTNIENASRKNISLRKRKLSSPSVPASPKDWFLEDEWFVGK